MSAYIQTFPQEEREVKTIYKQTTGHAYTTDLPPSFWFLVKNDKHRLLTFDPYGGISIPLYTFNLNSGEAEDLVTIKGISWIEAESIISYREKISYFSDLDQLNKIPDLGQETIDRLLSRN